MAYYTNTKITSDLKAVEFIPRPDSNVAFFYTKTKAGADHLKSGLAGLNQEVLGESKSGDSFVLITRGTKTEEEIKGVLAKDHDVLKLREPEKKFQPWEWRGRFSDIGQSLNLVSSLQAAKRTGKSIQEDKLAFAALNLTANWVNKKYGAQKAEDGNQLNLLKTEINKHISPFLQPGAQLPAIDDSRAELRSEPPKKQTMGEKFDGFMKKNSVRLGEIGLRYMGSIALVLSYPQLKKMGNVQTLLTKDVMVNGEKKAVEYVSEEFKFSKAWQAMKAKPASEAFGLLNKDKTLLGTGAVYLIGKTLGLTLAKTPDPYDPKPKTAFETFREKYAFRVSTAIETGAASLLAVGSFKKKDYLSGVGGATVGMGLVSRFFAPFGVKQVDKKELDAHIVDSLAMVPDDNRAEALSRTASYLKEHFKNAPETYGEIFTHLKDKLYHDRGIALYPAPVQQPAEQQQALQMTQEDNSMLKSVGIASEPVNAQKAFADASLRKNPPESSMASYVERASQPAEAAAAIR